MFRKLFLSFWVTVIVAGAALELLALAVRRAEQRAEVQQQTLLARARDAARAQRIPNDMTLLDVNGRAIGGRAPLPAEQDVARGAARLFDRGFTGAAYGDARRGLVAKTFVMDGSRYTVIARTKASLLAWLPSRGLTPLVIVLIVGGFVCVLLARHFASPLERLSVAANAVADGRLDTRAGPRLAARRDEIGALARDFDRMAARIEALVAAERRTLADASHELRSPLARLNVALTLARRQPQSDQYLDRIEREAERLDRMISELLTLARIDSGAESAGEQFDLAALVEEIVADGDFEAHANGRRVRLLYDGACEVNGNRELLRSAIENVVRNAVRHTATAVDVELRCDAEHARLCVRDDGPGLDPEVLAEIFRPFHRLDAQGTGLGLAIADRIIRLHHGTIAATNSGGGLVVVIDLPRRKRR